MSNDAHPAVQRVIMSTTVQQISPKLYSDSLPQCYPPLQVMLARACVTFAPAFAGQYYSTCAVGFSAVLFAMKVVLNSNSPGWTSVAGISLPTKVHHHVASRLLRKEKPENTTPFGVVLARSLVMYQAARQRLLI